MHRFARSFVLVLVSFVVFGSVSIASAQSSDDDRARAAEAYDRGARAFRSQDFGESAGWFERANVLAPSPIALVQAVRAHLRARNFLRAGTLALSLEGDPGLSPRVQETVREAMGEATVRYVRVEITCTASCTLTIDGESQSAMRFFLEPDREATIVATFSNGSRTETVTGAAGTTKSVAFEAPEGALSAEAVAESADDVLDLEDSDNPYRISSVAFLSRPRATAFTAIAASAAIAGIATWSALDTRNSRERLHAAIDEGADETIIDRHRREHDRDVHRTRGYLGFTGVVVVLSGLVAAFTDWTPERSSSPSTSASVSASREGGGVVVTHTF